MTRAAAYLEGLADGPCDRSPPMDVGGLLGPGPAVGPGARAGDAVAGVRLDPAPHLPEGVAIF